MTQNYTVCVCICVCARMLSHVQLFTTPCTIACQAPLIMGFSREEYWSGLSRPLPRGPHSVRPLHHDPSVLGGPTGHGLVSLS